MPPFRQNQASQQRSEKEPRMSASIKLHIDDVRIQEIKELVPPAHVLRIPCHAEGGRGRHEARQAIHRILYGADDRLLVVIGPLDPRPKAAMEYAHKLPRPRPIASRTTWDRDAGLFPPRATVGWKGLINDPGLDNSFRINDGVRLARKLLGRSTRSACRPAPEFLDMITPQFTSPT